MLDLTKSKDYIEADVEFTEDQLGHVAALSRLSSAPGVVVDSEGRCETKEEVFEDLLSQYRFNECLLENIEHGDKYEAEFDAGIIKWRDRYAKAKSPIEGQEE